MLKNFINYLKEVKIEIRKIEWPNRETIKEQTKGVVVLSLAVAGIISLYDYALAQFLKFLINIR